MLIDHAAHSFLSFWQLNHNYFSIIYFLSSALLEPGIYILFLFPFTFIGSIFQFQGDTSMDA